MYIAVFLRDVLEEARQRELFERFRLWQIARSLVEFRDPTVPLMPGDTTYRIHCTSRWGYGRWSTPLKFIVCSPEERQKQLDFQALRERTDRRIIKQLQRGRKKP